MTTRENLRQEENRYRYIKQRIFSHEKFQKDRCVIDKHNTFGAFIAYVCEGKDYVGWLAWGKNVGVESFAIDLYVIKFNIGLMVHATISQIFTIAAALIVFSKTCKGL